MVEDKTTVAPLFLLYFLPHGRPVIPSSLGDTQKDKKLLTVMIFTSQLTK